MLKKRIIPCLDIKDGRTVKGVNFKNLLDAGDPVQLAKLYADQGADELVFLDITATLEKRKTLAALVTKIAKEIDIPFTVGGGIKSLEDVEVLVAAGADKVSINSAAVKNPTLIRDIAKAFGSQCVVVALDVKPMEQENPNDWLVYTRGGRTPTTLHAIDWAKQAQDYGAGELLLTSMEADGTKAGFSLDITDVIARAVDIPVIASGGAGSKAHFKTLFEDTKASAGLAASIFHFKEIEIPELKNYLQSHQIPVRVRKEIAL